MDKKIEETREWIRIHDIIQFVNTFYGMSYAENSRETLEGSIPKFV